MDGVTATTAELNYVDGVTGNIQTQLNGKQATISGAATTITGSNLTASRALVSNSSGKVAVSAVTSTELGYLDGVTSAIQTQLNNKAPSSHEHAASDITSGTLPSDRLPTVPITKGGTGATSASTARTNLNVYSKSEVDSELSNYVPTTRTINSKALSSNVTLSASDVGADAAGTASSAVSTHNSDSSAHSDIRNSITVKYDQGVKIYTSANWVHRNYVEFANGLYYTDSQGESNPVFYAGTVDEWSGSKSLPTGMLAFVYE